MRWCVIAKQKACQKYIYKIHSNRIRKAGWDLTLSIAEARRNDETIAIADSQVLRWLDELNGIVDAEEQAREIKKEIKRIKKEPNSVQNSKKIGKLYSQLDNIQFKPDYLCVIIDKIKDYHRLCQGFKINGTGYQRLVGTNGGVKNRTIVFISDRHADEIKARLNNNRDMTKKLVPTKLEAYKALACSASIPVSMPNGILVVDDCETHFLTDIVYLSDELDGEPVMEDQHNVKVDLIDSDGYGLMLPSLAERWSEELDLDYVVSGVNTRFCWEKGMVFNFDFIDFAEKIAGNYIVKDVWGNEVDIRNVELILTTSMLKLWDCYKSCDEYINSCLKNKYTFCVTKTAPKELESERTLNYQFIQSYDLDSSNIEELIKPTMDEFKDILDGDPMKAVLFLKGTWLNEKNVERLDDDYIKALMIEPKMLDDPYVQNCIYHLIKTRIDEAKIGVLKVHGNYSIVSGDPFSLCQHIFGLPVTGLLKSGQIYNKYWVGCESKSLACFRAPMTCHNNIRMVHPYHDEMTDYWYRNMTTCTIFNSFDTSAHALNGMDKDGDLVMLTDNTILVQKLRELPAVMCIQRKAEKIDVTEEATIQSNIDSFGDDIGKITNWVTSMYSVRARFNRNSREYKELDYRIKCGQLYQQEAMNLRGLTQ